MTPLDLPRAIAALETGGLVIFPTETVYGLGADASSDQAVAQIYAVKGRPSFNPLIVHVGDVAQAQTLGMWNEKAQALADAFWPGPLTIVLLRLPSARLSPIVSAGTKTIALRCPAAQQARDLAAALPSGVAAPSANKSGQLSPTREAHLTTAFAAHPNIGFLPGKGPSVGLESTVVDLSKPSPEILRQGGVTKAQLMEVLGSIGENELYYEDFGDAQVSSPGQLRRHYAPPVPLLLSQRAALPGQALLAFGPDAPAAQWVFNLSSAGDLVEAASRLFEGLHVLGGCGASAIAAMPIPDEGIGRAINDRLRRGAVPPG